MEKSLPLKGKGESLRLPAKATIYYMLTGALAKTVGILSTPVFTRILSSEDYGKYTLYMSWLGLLSVVCCGIISQTVIYRGLEKFREEKSRFIFSAFLLSSGFTLGICILLFAFSRIFSINQYIVLILSVQLFCDVIINLSQTLRRYRYAYLTLSLTNALSVALTPILSIALIDGASLGYEGRIFALLIIGIIIALPNLFQILKNRVFGYSKKITLYIAKHSVSLLPSLTSSALAIEIDKLILTALLGPLALAKYSVAHTVGLGLGFAVNALASSLYPWVIRKLNRQADEAVVPVFRTIIIALGACGCAISLILPELFTFLAPSEYSEAKTSTLPLLISSLPSFTSSFITVGIVHAEKGGYTSISAIASVFFGVIFNLVFIPIFGFFGAALSNLLSSIITLLINYFYLKKCSLSKMLSLGFFAVIFVFCAFIFYLSTRLYPYPAVRILFLILPATMLLYAYSGIRDFIKEPG